MVCLLYCGVCVQMLLYLMAFLEQCFVAHAQYRIPDEQRLIRKLMRRYDPSARPVFNASEKVVVEFGLTLIQIIDMDERNQVIATNVWLEHSWLDERLTWDPSEYNNLIILRIPASKLWLPDIVLYNNADDYTRGYMPTNAMVEHTGIVQWMPPSRLRSSCKVNTTLFPFDQQTCKLKFGSWTYNKAQVDMVNRSAMMDLSNYMSNGEWALLDTSITRNEVVYPISPAVYPDITIAISIQRRIIYYILNIIMPCVWLNVLNLLAFCLPPDAGEKITLGITVFLSYSIFMLLIAESMPPTSEFVPLIGIYLTISMAVTSLSIILTVFVLNLHHARPHQRQLPRWVRYLVLHVIASILRCRCASKAQRKPQKTDSNHIGKTESLRLASDANRRSPVTELRASRLLRRMPHQEDYYIYPESEAESRLQTLMEEASRCLKKIVARREQDDQNESALTEWQDVAAVFDRLLFIFWFLVTLLATLVLIVIIPYTRYTRKPELLA